MKYRSQDQYLSDSKRTLTLRLSFAFDDSDGSKQGWNWCSFMRPKPVAIHSLIHFKARMFKELTVKYFTNSRNSFSTKARSHSNKSWTKILTRCQKILPGSFSGSRVCQSLSAHVRAFDWQFAEKNFYFLGVLFNFPQFDQLFNDHRLFHKIITPREQQSRLP